MRLTLRIKFVVEDENVEEFGELKLDELDELEGDWLA